MTRVERLIAVLAPFAAAVAVVAGLRLGAPQDAAAAVIYGAPVGAAATAAAWQVFAFHDEDSGRQPMVETRLSIVARQGERSEEWRGTTNADGMAEALLPLPVAGVRLEVRAGGALLARGDAAVRPRSEPASLYGAWAPFARRSGRLAIDVAVLGQRVAPGFPSTLCVHVTDAITHLPIPGVGVVIDDDPSLTRDVGAGAPRSTDAAGWAQLRVVPVGLAVSLTLRVRRGWVPPPAGQASREQEGASLRTPPRQKDDLSDSAQWAGEWVGGLHVSPGAAELQTLPRWAPTEDPEIDVVAPTQRALVYVEVDDNRGRVWATSAPLEAKATGALPSAAIRVPRLAPGLYWAVAASDPHGASELGPGTSARPFFVASTDEAALAFGIDPAVCVPRTDARDNPSALWPCLAVAQPRPVERWIALDGTAAERAHARMRRSRGVAIAVGALGVAALLELALLLRAAAQSRARLRLPFEPSDARPSALALSWTVAVALLVALLGFVLLAAFVERGN